jgi:predicted amidophosphoribosyltransferase
MDPRSAWLAVRARQVSGPPTEARCRRCGMPLPQNLEGVHCPDCLMYLAVAGYPPPVPEAPLPPPAAVPLALDAVRADFAWVRTRLAHPRSDRACADCGEVLPPAGAYPWERCPTCLVRRATETAVAAGEA